MASLLKFVPDSLSFANTEDSSCFPSLSFRERLMGFLLCLGLSIFLYILAWYRMVSILVGDSTRFAITYTMGNLLSILATGFLIGFKRQLSTVCDENRRLASTIYLGAMVLTLFSSMILQNSLITLVAIGVQVVAFVWYSASYVPWGRDCLRSCFKNAPCFSV